MPRPEVLTLDGPLPGHVPGRSSTGERANQTGSEVRHDTVVTIWRRPWRLPRGAPPLVAVLGGLITVFGSVVLVLWLLAARVGLEMLKSDGQRPSWSHLLGIALAVTMLAGAVVLLVATQRKKQRQLPLFIAVAGGLISLFAIAVVVLWLLAEPAATRTSEPARGEPVMEPPADRGPRGRHSDGRGRTTRRQLSKTEPGGNKAIRRTLWRSNQPDGRSFAHRSPWRCLRDGRPRRRVPEPSTTMHRCPLRLPETPLPS